MDEVHLSVFIRILTMYAAICPARYTYGDFAAIFHYFPISIALALSLTLNTRFDRSLIHLQLSLLSIYIKGGVALRDAGAQAATFGLSSLCSSRGT